MSIAEPEVIDISDLGNGGTKSANFGPGIELLMNDRVGKKSSGSDDLGLEDLTDLEKELNDLTADEIPISLNIDTKEMNFSKETDNLHVSFDKIDANEPSGPTINLGKASSENATENQTWDGYGQFNNIPLNPDADVTPMPKTFKRRNVKRKV